MIYTNTLIVTKVTNSNLGHSNSSNCLKVQKVKNSSENTFNNILMKELEKIRK